MTLRVLQQSLAEPRPHFAAFFVIGDPEPAISHELAVGAVKAGATMLELGIAYSDPCADGVAIQRAAQRALAAGTSTDAALAQLAALRAALPRTPLNLLVYANLVHARGLDAFCRDAAAAGASSLLVPDVPLEESIPLQRACREADLGHVPLLSVRTPAARRAALAATASGFVYLAAQQAVTGARREAPADDALRAASAVPVCVGFGLSSAAQVAAAFAAGARIAVVGSHLAQLIERTPRPALPEALASRCRALAAAAATHTDSVSRAAGTTGESRRSEC